jgi:hypothetical protein
MACRGAASQVAAVSPKLLPLGLGSGKALPRLLRDDAPFLIGRHGHDPYSQTVGTRHVSGYEINVGLLQAQQEVSISAQAYQPRNDEGGIVEATQTESLNQLGPVGSLVGRDFNDFGDKLPPASVQVVGNSLTLRLQIKAAVALLGLRHLQI